MQQTGAAPDAPRDQLPAEGPLSDEQRAQLFGWLVAMKEAMAAPADNPTAAPAPGPDARLPWPEAPLLQSPMQQPPPPWSAQQQLLPQVLRQAQQASEYEQTQQPERQPWAFEAPAPPAGGGSNLLSMLSAGLPNLLSPVTPAAGAPASLPAPLFLGSPAATPLSGGGAGLFGGDTSFLNGGLNSGRMPGLHAPGLGSGGISGGPGGAGVGSSGDLADGADGQAGLAFQAALQQVPLWSAADVLPATLGAGGLLDLAPGTVLPPPPPMPQPLNAGGDGPAVFRSRAPRREWVGGCGAVAATPACPASLTRSSDCGFVPLFPQPHLDRLPAFCPTPGWQMHPPPPSSPAPPAPPHPSRRTPDACCPLHARRQAGAHHAGRPADDDCVRRQ